MLWISGGIQGSSHTVLPDLLIFGAGLVGSAVAEQYLRRANGEVRSFPFSWNEPQQRLEQKDHLQKRAVSFAARGKRLEILWSAGSGGFASSEDEFGREMEAFANVLDLVDSIANAAEKGAVAFHLVSSAGGLFEGQRFVSAADAPSPRRPYATAKLRQEQLSAEILNAKCRIEIYRPSTIYGFARLGRAGLILALIKNGLTYRTTTIVGESDTLRDYIHVSDVARYISNSIALQRMDTRLSLLCTGKPTSMMEAISSVERVIQRKLILNFAKSLSNAKHNTYKINASDLQFEPMPLLSGIRQTLNSWTSNEYFRSVYGVK